MSWCIEHEKYPNCVRLCTVVSVIDDLFVTVDRNTLYIVYGSISRSKNLNVLFGGKSGQRVAKHWCISGNDSLPYRLLDVQKGPIIPKKS